jgi:addiction module RelE/StbE family toxin
MRIKYTPRFEKSYSNLPDHVKKKAEKREKIFRKDPFDKRLDNHKLHGKLEGLRAFSIDNKYRIVFKFNDSGDAYFLRVGDHDIYR